MKTIESVETQFHRMLANIWKDTQIDGSNLSMAHYKELMDMMEKLQMVVKDIKTEQTS